VKLPIRFALLAAFSSLSLSLLTITPAYASDVDIYNVSLQNANTTNDTVDIKFDLAQDNVMTAGTDANTAAFYDRVWIFVKYSTDSGATWNHATLTTGGSITTYASGIGISADGMGAFCSPGTNQTVRWDYGADSVADNATAQVRAFAIEMVLIPTGDFYAGDASSTDRIMDKDDDASALISTTGNVIYSADTNYDDAQFGQSGAGILVDGDGGIDEDGTTTISNANYPTGYGAFYIMKYEISQAQYVTFLNTLTRAQQQTRTYTNVSTDTITNIFAMSNTATISCRSGIACPGSGNGTTDPITFGVDGDSDGNFNESDDGQWRAANYLSWIDVCAYADWAGLRPFTELEFEKACRGGGVTAVAGEYAWGNTTIDYFSDLSNDGTATETIGPTRANANCNYSTATPDGSVRCGMFATGSSSRQDAGASYYGAMELSGNLWERPVTIGTATGRAFAGTHGNGSLTTNGNANNSDWPGYVTSEITGATGSGFRGGYWSNASRYARVSDRSSAAHVRTKRYSIYGGRCARTSP